MSGNFLNSKELSAGDKVNATKKDANTAMM
jgi:hypothetical protein